MDFKTDRNLTRRDLWFSSPDDVLPFLVALCREHSRELPDTVSSALLQARRNILPPASLDALKRETARLLRLLRTAEVQCAKAA